MKQVPSPGPVTSHEPPATSHQLRVTNCARFTGEPVLGYAIAFCIARVTQGFGETAVEITIRYYDEDRCISAEPGTSLLEVSLRNKIPHMRECGGRGRCTTCRVRVLDGADNLSPRNEIERAVAKVRKWDDFTRLACQAKVVGSVTVERLVKQSEDVLSIYLNEEPMAAGVERKVAVLFSDIRGFTRFSDAHLPYDVVHVLNRYFARVCEPVLSNNGYIDKYLGDGLLAVFGIRENNAEIACRNAVRAALGMRESLRHLNRALRSEFDAEFRMGVGIHHGVAILGRIGHPSKRPVTVIGDTVNVASRLESLTKDLGVDILVSETVADALGNAVHLEAPHETILKGRTTPTRVFPMIGFRQDDPILLVQSSFERILHDKYEFGPEFYKRLFADTPALQDLFRSDIQSQSRMLVQMLTTVIQSLNRLSDVLPGIRELGRRHVAYGVLPEHYAAVKRALLGTLENYFTEDWALMKDAWDEVLQSVIDNMIAGIEPDGRVAA